MLLLDSVEILAAVRRSLETHVLPQLQDDFARVQIASALRALDEVSDRLEHGDPCDAMNAQIEAGAREIAESNRESAPAFSAELSRALESVASGVDARERNRQLVEALWRLVSRKEEPAADQLWALLRDEAIKRAADDSTYISGEAVASLT